MTPSVKRHAFTVPKAIAGIVLLLYGCLTLYAKYGLQPNADYIFAENNYRDPNALIVSEYVDSVTFSAGWNGFRARICQPVFSSPEQEGFPPATMTLPGCATITVPYFSNRIIFSAPDAEAQIVYNGTHRIVTRSELKGEILFKRYADARRRIRRLLLGQAPLSAKLWTENIRFYSERDGAPPAYAAAEHLSLLWESPQGNTAVALPGSRALVSVKHIIGGAERGSDDDRQLFPVSFTGEFRMEEDQDSGHEHVRVDTAKLFFKDFAVVAYGEASPAGEKNMYPTADFIVEIDNYDNALNSALPAKVFLPQKPNHYDKGTAMARQILNALTHETESDGQLRRYRVIKKAGEDLSIGGKSVNALIELYNNAYSRSK